MLHTLYSISLNTCATLNLPYSSLWLYFTVIHQAMVFLVYWAYSDDKVEDSLKNSEKPTFLAWLKRLTLLAAEVSSMSLRLTQPKGQVKQYSKMHHLGIPWHFVFCEYSNSSQRLHSGNFLFYLVSCLEFCGFALLLFSSQASSVWQIFCVNFRTQNWNCTW